VNISVRCRCDRPLHGGSKRPASSLTSPPSQGPEEWPIRRRSTDRISSPGRHTRTRSASIDVETATGSGAGRAPAQGGATDSGAEVEVLVLGQIASRCDSGVHPRLGQGAGRVLGHASSRRLHEAWATALWPDRLMAPSSLHSTASVAGGIGPSEEWRRPPAPFTRAVGAVRHSHHGLEPLCHPRRLGRSR